MISDPRPTNIGPQTAIVFGGAGFIGSHLVSDLIGRGASVTIADVNAPARLPANATFRYCDMRQPISVSREQPFDVVYNLAAVHRTPGHEPHEYYSTNVRGALNLVDWMQEGGETELYFTSSIAVYGPSAELKTEATPPAPTSDYGHSKLLAEDIFRNWHSAHVGHKLVIIRPAVVFGPGEGGNFARLAKALKHRTFVYPGCKDVVKSSGYVGDLVKTFAFAKELSDRFLLLNFCYPHRSTIEEICQAFHAVAGYPLPRTLPPRLVRLTIATLRLVNPGDRGSLSASRVEKLTASTNVTPDELARRGFEWDTDIDSALREWQTASNGRFV